MLANLLKSTGMRSDDNPGEDAMMTMLQDESHYNHMVEQYYTPRQQSDTQLNPVLSPYQTTVRNYETMDLDGDIVAWTQDESAESRMEQAQIQPNIALEYNKDDPDSRDQPLHDAQDEDHDSALQSSDTDQRETGILHHPVARHPLPDRLTKTPEPGDLEAWTISALWPLKDDTADSLETPADLAFVERAPLHVQIQAYMRRWAIWASEIKDEDARRDLFTAISNRVHDSWIYAIDQGYYPKFRADPGAEDDADKHEEKARKGRKKVRNPFTQPADFASNSKDPLAITNGELSAVGVTMDMINARVLARNLDRGEVLIDELLTRNDRDTIEVSDWSATRRIATVRNRNLLVYCLWAVQESRKEITKLEKLRAQFKKGVQIRNTTDRINTCRERINQHLALAVELDGRNTDETGEEDEDEVGEADDCVLVGSGSTHEIDSDSNASTPHDDKDVLLEVARHLLSASNYEEVVEVFTSREISHKDLETDGLRATTPLIVDMKTELGRVLHEIYRVNMLKQKQRHSDEPKEALKIGHELNLSRQKLMQSRQVLHGLLARASGQSMKTSNTEVVHSPGPSIVQSSQSNLTPQHIERSETNPFAASPSITISGPKFPQANPSPTANSRRPLVLDVKPPLRSTSLQANQSFSTLSSESSRLVPDAIQPTSSDATPPAADMSSPPTQEPLTAKTAMSPSTPTATTSLTGAKTQIHAPKPIGSITSSQRQDHPLTTIAPLQVSGTPGHQDRANSTSQATPELLSPSNIATETQVLKQIYANKVWLPWLKNQYAVRQQQGQQLALLPESLDGWNSIKKCLTDMGAGPTERNSALELFTSKWHQWSQNYSNQQARLTQTSNLVGLSPQLQHGFPSDTEIIQAIPPEGIVAGDLIKLFGTRIADSSNEFGNAVNRVAVYDPRTHMSYGRDITPVASLQQEVTQQSMVPPPSPARTAEYVLTQTPGEQQGGMPVQAALQMESIGRDMIVPQSSPLQHFPYPSTEVPQEQAISRPQFVNPAQLMYNPPSPLLPPFPLQPTTVTSTQVSQLPTAPPPHHDHCTAPTTSSSTRQILKLRFSNPSKDLTNSDRLSTLHVESKHDIDTNYFTTNSNNDSQEHDEDEEEYSPHTINETRGFAFRYSPSLPAAQRQSVEDQIDSYVKAHRTKKQRALVAGTYVSLPGGGAHGVWRTSDGGVPTGMEWFFEGKEGPGSVEQQRQQQKKKNEGIKMKMKIIGKTENTGEGKIRLGSPGLRGITSNGSVGGSDRGASPAMKLDVSQRTDKSKKRGLSSLSTATTSSSSVQQGEEKARSKRRRRIVCDGDDDGDGEYIPDSGI